MSEPKVTVVIEIPQNSLIKYEYDKETKALFVDRILKSPVPFNYGYVPDTLSADGDPLDAFVLGDMPIHPLARVNARVVGVFRCIDNGEEDDKLVCSMGSEPYFSWEVDSGIDVIRSYLENYKAGFQVLSYEGKEAAIKTLLSSGTKFECVNNYLGAV